MVKTFLKDTFPSYVELKSYKLSEGLIITLADVTKIKQDEEELKRNESLYRSVVDDQSDIFAVSIKISN